MLRNQDIQLLPETRTRLDLGTNGGKKFFISGAAILAVSVALVLLLSWYKGSLEQRISQIDSDLTALESKRDKKFENNLLVLDRQISLVASLLDKHVYWSTALDKVERLLQTQVQITRVELKEHSIIEVDGVAANYSTVAKQIAAFLTDSAVDDVGLRGVRATNTGVVEFTMQIKIKPESLLKNDKQK